MTIKPGGVMESSAIEALFILAGELQQRSFYSEVSVEADHNSGELFFNVGAQQFKVTVSAVEND